MYVGEGGCGRGREEKGCTGWGIKAYFVSVVLSVFNF